MPAPTYIGFVGSGDTHPDGAIGADSAETGIMLDSFDADLDPSEVAFFDRFGAQDGAAVLHAAVMTYTVTGEVGNANSGVLAATFISAATLANEDMFASSAGHMGVDFSTSDTILTGASWTQPRGEKRAVTLNYRRSLGMLVAS